MVASTSRARRNRCCVSECDVDWCLSILLNRCDGRRMKSCCVDLWIGFEVL